MPRGKCPVGLGHATLLESLLDHTFKSMNAETYHLKRNKRGLYCEKELNLAGKAFHGKFWAFMTGRGCAAFDNGRLLWLFHCYWYVDLSPHWRAKHTTLFLFHVSFMLSLLSSVFCVPNTRALSVCKFWDVKDRFMREIYLMKKEGVVWHGVSRMRSGNSLSMILHFQLGTLALLYGNMWLAF